MKSKKDPNLEGKNKRKELLKSGVLAKKGHLSSQTRRKQGQRDDMHNAEEFAAVMVGPIADVTTPQVPLEIIYQESYPLPSGRRLRFVGIPTSEALREYIRRRSQTIMQRISARPRRYRMKVWVSPEAKRSDGLVSLFKVKVEVVITGRKSLITSSSERDVHYAVDGAIQMMESKIQRDTEKKERSRKTLGRSMQSIRDFVNQVSAPPIAEQE